MQVDGFESQCFIRRAMIARIATLSRNGRPSINPLYFVFTKGVIWLGTDDWTLAARNVSSDARVSVLFALEKDRLDERILRVTGSARICKDQKMLRSYNLRVAFKYILPLAGILNALAHIHQIPLKLTYNAQGRQKGVPCIIEVTPEQVEFL
jgi:hypothetical protein